jgi:uncharacterized membrane protein
MESIKIVNWVFQIITTLIMCGGLVAFTAFCVNERKLQKKEFKEKSIKERINNN